MSDPITAEKVLSFAAGLSAEDRAKLLRSIAALAQSGAASAYNVHPPGQNEFGSDDDALAWDADGWDAFD